MPDPARGLGQPPGTGSVRSDPDRRARTAARTGSSARSGASAASAATWSRLEHAFRRKDHLGPRRFAGADTRRWLGRLAWSWARLFKRGLIAGVGWAILVGVFAGFVGWVLSGPSVVVSYATVGLILELCFGLIGAGLDTANTDQRDRPNQGIRTIRSVAASHRQVS